jgi:hypothetical protein
MEDYFEDDAAMEDYFEDDAAMEDYFALDVKYKAVYKNSLGFDYICIANYPNYKLEPMKSKLISDMSKVLCFWKRMRRKLRTDIVSGIVTIDTMDYYIRKNYLLDVRHGCEEFIWTHFRNDGEALKQIYEAVNTSTTL